MELDGEPLDERQWLGRLAGKSVGRLVYTVGALPAVLPVRFSLDRDGSVLLRAQAGAELVRAVDGAVVAFEAGEVSDADGSGWTVTVLGRAVALPATTPVTPGQVVVRIWSELVTGRRLGATAAVPTV
jgi:hypothetical protein